MLGVSVVSSASDPSGVSAPASLEPAGPSSSEFDQVFASVNAPAMAGGGDGSLVLSDGTALSFSPSSQADLGYMAVGKFLSMKEDGLSDWEKVDKRIADIREKEAESQSTGDLAQDFARNMLDTVELSSSVTAASMTSTLRISLTKKVTEGIQQLVRAQ